MNSNPNATKVVLNTPGNLDLAQFGAINKSKNIHKIIWLIHRINKFTKRDGSLKMHKETYYKFLGLSPSDLNKYLLMLINMNIIKQTKVGNNITECLSEFVYIEPFEQSTANKHTYSSTDKKCPLFIRKWVADDFAVKRETSYKKISGTKTKSKKMITNTEDVSGIIKSQSLEIESLKEEVERLREQLNKTEQPFETVAVANELFTLPRIKIDSRSEEEVCLTSDNTLKLSNDNNEFFNLVNEDYSGYVIEQLKKNYKPYHPTIIVTDEDFNKLKFRNNRMTLERMIY